MIPRSRISIWTFALLFCGACFAPALAQEHSDYHLFGTVSDSQGQGIAGVRIALKDKETGRQVVIKTNDVGTFDQQFVPHAVYGVSIEKEGYVTKKIENLDLSVWGTESIDKKLDFQLRTEAEEAELHKQQQLATDYKKGIDLFQAGRWDETIAVMQTIAAASPDRYEPLNILARAYFNKRDIDKTIEYLSKSIALKGDLAEDHQILGDCYIAKKDYPQAIAAYERLLQLKPDDAAGLCTLGNLLLAADLDDKAEPHIRRGLELNNALPLCHKLLAQVLLRRGELLPAAASLKKYLELQPDAPDKAQITETIQALEKGD
jgi:tetratricopeptide (TPR) repeat protein